jgi:hypothetical protein
LAAFNNWNFISLSTFWANILYIYLLLNGFGAAALIYKEEHSRNIEGKFCPKCNNALRALTEYECPTCGKIEFKKEE